MESESGKNNQRPKLMEAIDLCKASGATLVVAKIDMLTRNAAFLLSLKDAGIEFIAADMPDVRGPTMRATLTALLLTLDSQAGG